MGKLIILNVHSKLITTMTGHIKTVRSVKFTSPKTAVSASKDGTLRMWDLKTGVCQAILTSDPGERIIDMVATTQYAVSGGHNGTAKVWSLQEHKQLFTLSDHTKLIYRVACQDNKIFTGSLDHDVRVWDLKTGETLAALKGHDSLVSQITMHEDALVTGGADGKIIIWSLLDYAPLHTISKAHENAVTSLDVRNGQILSGGSDGAVKLWDLHTGEVVGDLGMLTQAAWRVSLGRGENRSVIVVSAQGVSGSSAHFDACLDVSDNMAVYRSTNTDTSRYGCSPDGPLEKKDTPAITAIQPRSEHQKWHFTLPPYPQQNQSQTLLPTPHCPFLLLSSAINSANPSTSLLPLVISISRVLTILVLYQNLNPK